MKKCCILSLGMIVFLLSIATPGLAVRVYDAALGTLPENQGWTMTTGTPGSPGYGDWYLDDGVLYMPFQSGTSEGANAYAQPPMEHPDLSPMILEAGFSVRWDYCVTNNVNGTSVGGGPLAPFTVWVVGNTPGLGVHFGITDTQVFVYRGNPTVAQTIISLANFLAGYQPGDWVDYRLDILGSSFCLFANDVEIYCGQLEQFTHPTYSVKKNYLFFGNDNGVSSGDGKLSYFDVDLPVERVLFTAHNDSDTELWMANADGSNPVQLTDASGQSANGRISPDGEDMAFVSSRDGSPRVYLMDLADGNPQPIFTAPVPSVWHAELAWSPDGTELAVKMVIGTSMRLTVIDRQGNVQRSRDFSGRTNAAFDWSDDGQWFVYANETIPNSSPSNELFKLNANLQGTPIRLTNNSKSDGDVRICTPAGKLVYNQYINGYTEPRVFSCNFDGSNQQQLITEAVSALRPLCNPASDNVVYTRAVTDNDKQLYIAPLDGSAGPSLFIGAAGPLAGKELYIEDWASVKVELTLQAPNGGQSIYTGGTCGNVDILWTSRLAGPTVDLAYSSDHGATWHDIGTVPNTGSYSWSVPEMDSDYCLIRIVDAADPCVADVSDAPFATHLGSDLIADLDGNCWVDWADFSIFASQWLLGNPSY